MSPPLHRPSSLPTGRAGPSLWTGSWCTACPGRPVCTSADSADACGDPAEYAPKSLHPADLHAGESSRHHLDLTRLAKSFDRGAAVLHGSVLFVADGSTRTPGEAVRLRNALRSLSAGSHESQLGRVAVLQGGDRLLYRLWRRRGRAGAALVDAGYRAAIGPGFSTWADHTPWQSLVATAMSVSVAADLSRHLPTVPTLVWRNHEDLDRWAAWVGEHDLGQIALHPGALRGLEEWTWWMDGLARLRSCLSDPSPRLAVTGPCVPERIRAVLDIWGTGVTYVTQHPWELAIHGKALQSDLSYEPAASDEPASQLFEANCATFSDFVDAEMRSMHVANSMPPRRKMNRTAGAVLQPALRPTTPVGPAATLNPVNPLA